MERKVIIEAFNKRFSKLDDCMGKLTISFTPDNIHKFRIEIKKLRALFRLVKEGKDHAGHLKIPKKIKQLYKAAGIVRSLQLQEEHLSSTSSKNNWRQPDIYFNKLHSDKNDAMDHARKIIGWKGISGKWEARIIKFLLNRNGKTNIKHFVHFENVQLIQLLEMKQPGDKSLHKLRKLIKNVQYAWPFIRRHASIVFPPAFRSYQRLKLLSDLLGQFHDVCVDLTHLDSIIGDRSSFPKERRVLTDIKGEWQTNKENIRRALMNRIITVEDISFSGEERPQIGI